MLSKNQDERNVMEIVSIDTLVPSDHLLRKIDEAIDFEHIYDIVKDLYCEDNGRPSIDPVVLFKIVLIQHIYGIPSLRRTLEEINMNGISLVSWIFPDRSCPSFYHSKLQFLSSI